MTSPVAKRLVQSIARSLTVCLRHCGVGLDEVKSAFDDAYSDNNLPVGDIDEGADRIDAYQLDVCARMIHTWRDDNDYIDDMGRPLEIDLEGDSPSLEDLFQRTVTEYGDGANDWSLSDCLNTLLESDTVKVDETNKVRQTGINLRVAGTTKGAIIQLGYIETLATTVANNVVKGGRWHVESRVTRFPKKNIWMIERFLNDRGQRFIRDVDLLMESERDKSSQSDVIDVGVCVFRFESDSSSV